MYTVRTMNQNNRRKDFVPVYIFIDCATSLKHYNNYYFSINPRSAFIVHYHEEGNNIKRKQTFQCHYCDMFFRYKNKFIRHFNHCSGTSRIYLYFSGRRCRMLWELFGIQERFSIYCSWRSPNSNRIHFWNLGWVYVCHVLLPDV